MEQENFDESNLDLTATIFRGPGFHMIEQQWNGQSKTRDKKHLQEFPDLFFDEPDTADCELYTRQPPSELIEVVPFPKLSSQEIDDIVRECNSGQQPTFIADISECSGDQQPSIKVLHSLKKRNPPYLVTEEHKLLTTLPMQPVRVEVDGAKVGDKVQVLIKNKEDLFNLQPVKSCMNHREFENRPEDLPQEFNFFVSTWSRRLVSHLYKNIQGHPTVEKEVETNDVVKNGPNLSFSCVFLCPNSCQKPNKELTLIIKLLNQNKELVCVEYDLRVCKNVKRDHKDRLEHIIGSRKRPLKPNPSLDTEQPVVKCTKFTHMKQEPPQEMPVPIQSSVQYQDVPADFPENSLFHSAPKNTLECLLVHLKNEEHRQVVQDMVKLLGGTITPVSVQQNPSSTLIPHLM